MFRTRRVAFLGLVAFAASSAAFADTIMVPPTQPFIAEYGAPISLAEAKKVLAAADAEAERRGWSDAIAVVDPSGNLVAFEKMDETQLASGDVALAKARASARFRRPTKVFQDAVSSGNAALLSVPGIVANEGGIPLILKGKLVGAIGTSGGTGIQDSIVAEAGAKGL